MRKILLASLFFTFIATQLHGQVDTLTLESIFSQYEYSSDYFGRSKWINDGEGYTSLETSESVPDASDIVLYHTSDLTSREILINATQLIPEGSGKALAIADYEWSHDKTKLLIFTNTQRVWRYNTKGDYWVYDQNTDKLTKLGGERVAPSSLMFAKFSPDGNRVAYVREHNVYVESLQTKEIIQLTFDGSEDIINGTFDWAYEEEFHIRDGFRWSPDGKNIAFWQLDASGIRDFLMINNTDSAYSYTIPVQYPKVGTANSSCRVGVVSSTGGPTTWMNVEGDPTDNYIPRMLWYNDAKSLLLQHLNRLQNTIQLIKCDISSGNARVIFTETDKAWLDVVDDWQWLDKSGEELLWVSERNGWRQAYKLTEKEQSLQPVTKTSFDIIEITNVDTKNGWLYYTASPDNATQRYLYRSRLSGKGKSERLTPDTLEGTNTYNISPNAKWALHSYSNTNTPTVTSLIKIPGHTTKEVLTDNNSLKGKISKLEINPVEFFKVTIDDTVSLDGYMIKPNNFDPNKKYPVLFYVYGEPWNQTVLDRWGGSSYLFHQYVAQQGYIVMSIDNRGTPASKGRYWRKIVYGQIGILASADQAKATREIISQYPFVDKNRIGIWGWSGGGSMTLNALFRYPDIYQLGMSVAPVTNQLLYDNIYQERYMGLPSTNAEGYKKGSPVTFAKNLKGNLLLVHGTGDDNVHYQNSELLINELIRHGKMFSFMPYPNRSHGVYEGKNTSLHLRKHLVWYLKNNLQAGPK